MEKTPKSLRLHIGLFGRTNVGKSSLLNYIAGQDVAITSPVAGTTTDVVQKTMELLPIGPVVFLDTAGLDDVSELSGLRLKKTRKVFDMCDCIVLVAESGIWTKYEEGLLKEARSREIPVICVLNKSDLKKTSRAFLKKIEKKVKGSMVVSCAHKGQRDASIHA
ncbi:MAG TPA: GTP-binding protein, partial [Candidatus Omnitrophota bacterium]|nr:GTP-binding protein [Candidatus Omnitrophota bacterium]